PGRRRARAAGRGRGRPGRPGRRSEGRVRGRRRGGSSSRAGYGKGCTHLHSFGGVAMARTVYRGAFPIAPTTFDDRAELDLESQRRAIDFMIDSGVDGICILANFSEQFALSDDERERLTGAILDHVAGRAPIIVTTSHYSSRIAAERSRRAQAAGA